ncbi:MAG: VWA domain-containing protein [Acidobacteria bacterium]|nr:VWA domain-containing protein [Acidobacteriota bacterium]MBV9479071.1 VWA domain-containing protein [Acidobacteriota bacterium]
MRANSRLTSLLLTLALHGTVLVPAQAQAIRADESVQVNLVEVPVTVLTSDGQPVRDLTKDNFEVYDQGHRKEITNFEMIDVAARVHEPALEHAEISSAAARNFLILFDLGNSEPASLIRARGAAHEFVNRQVVPRDRVAVATIAPQQGFRIVANFSTDRKLASSAIDALGLPQLQMAGDPLLITVKDLGLWRDNAPAPPSDGRRVNPEAEAEAILKETAQLSRHQADQAQREYVKRELEEFSAMGAALDRIPGRKQVILLSEGFDPKVLQGHANAPSEETRAEQDAAESGEIWKIDNDARFGSSSSRGDLGAMVDALRRSDVVLSAIDIKGLRGNTDATAVNQGSVTKSNDALYLLTNDTGGIVFRNTNDLAGNFSQWLKSQEVTYVLAFNGATTQPGAFHNLRVKLVNAPKARVSYRPGYYEPRPVTSDVDRMLTAGEIIMNAIPVADVSVRALAAPIPRNERAEVPIVVETDGNSLLAGVTGPAVFEEFYVYAFDAKEIIADYAHQRMSLELAKVRDRVAAAGVKLYATLDLPPGDYNVRVLVVANGSRNGFTSIPVHVPRADEPYAVGAINDPRPWVMVKAADKQQNRAYPFALGDKTLVPAAQPSLARGATYDVEVVTHGLSAEGLQVEAHVEDAAGNASPATLTLAGRTNPDEQGNVKLLFRFAPQLASGRYSLTIALHGGASAAAAHVQLPFTVQ